jgi:hypothetical protein
VLEPDQRDAVLSRITASFLVKGRSGGKRLSAAEAYHERWRQPLMSPRLHLVC